MESLITEKPLSPARKALRDAIAVVETRKAAFDQAAKIAEAASAAVEQSRAAVSAFSDLDAQIVEAQLNVLKGGDRKVVDEMREAQRQRVLANEDLKISEQTQQFAQNEASEAKQALTAAEMLRDRLVPRILGERVSEIEGILAEMNRRRETLRVIIRGLEVFPPETRIFTIDQVARGALAGIATHVPCGAPEDWQPLMWHINGILDRKDNNAGGNPAGAKAEWREFALALLTDPAAEAPPLPD